MNENIMDDCFYLGFKAALEIFASLPIRRVAPVDYEAEINEIVKWWDRKAILNDEGFKKYKKTMKK
jgi:hypothetical protein